MTNRKPEAKPNRRGPLKLTLKGEKMKELRAAGHSVDDAIRLVDEWTETAGAKELERSEIFSDKPSGEKVHGLLPDEPDEEEFTTADALLYVAVAIDEHAERLAPKRRPFDKEWLTVYDQGRVGATVLISSIISVVAGATGTEIFLRGREMPLITSVQASDITDVIKASYEDAN